MDHTRECPSATSVDDGGHSYRNGSMVFHQIHGLAGGPTGGDDVVDDESLLRLMNLETAAKAQDVAARSTNTARQPRLRPSSCPIIMAPMAGETTRSGLSGAKRAASRVAHDSAYLGHCSTWHIGDIEGCEAPKLSRKCPSMRAPVSVNIFSIWSEVGIDRFAGFESRDGSTGYFRNQLRLPANQEGRARAKLRAWNC